MKSRTPPKIDDAPVPKGFGRMVGDSFDWWEESLNLTIPDTLWKRLLEKKNKAVELDDTRCTPIDVKLADVPFQLLPKGGTGGREFILINGDYRIEMASPNKNWCIKWRATSAALWSTPIEVLRDTIYNIFEKLGCIPKDQDGWQRLSRVDYCFDIHSPDFTREMNATIIEQTVCPSETKTRGDFVVQTGEIQTLTIGVGAPCQVQIYDKTREITEASNKTWLYDIWAVDKDTGEIGEYDLTSHVWRVEIRLRKNWLKPRKVNTPDAFLEKLQVSLCEALYNRRLCKRSKDSNRRRWPLHPLFVMVKERIGNPKQFLIIDRRPTGRASELKRIIKNNIAGSLRSLTVLFRRRLDELQEYDEFTEVEARNLMKEIFEEMLNDEDHEEKIRRASEKYELVDTHR